MKSPILLSTDDDSFRSLCLKRFPLVSVRSLRIALARMGLLFPPCITVMFRLTTVSVSCSVMLRRICIFILPKYHCLCASAGMSAMGCSLTSTFPGLLSESARYMA